MNVIIPDRQPPNYAKHLADKHRWELGFLAASVYQRANDLGHLRIATHNADPCGFILHGPIKKTLRIYQTCVETDLRRIEHGSELLEQLIQDAIRADVHQICLWCAEDLPANLFWEANGFTHTETRRKSRRRARRQYGYLLELTAGAAHRRRLADDKQWQTEKRLLTYFANYSGNSQAIGQRIARREE